MGTSYLKAGLEDSAVRGADTDIAENHSFIPRLAVGTEFGKNIARTGKF